MKTTTKSESIGSVCKHSTTHWSSKRRRRLLHSRNNERASCLWHVAIVATKSQHCLNSTARLEIRDSVSANMFVFACHKMGAHTHPLMLISRKLNANKLSIFHTQTHTRAHTHASWVNNWWFTTEQMFCTFSWHAKGKAIRNREATRMNGDEATENKRSWKSKKIPFHSQLSWNREKKKHFKKRKNARHKIKWNQQQEKTTAILFVVVYVSTEHLHYTNVPFFGDNVCCYCVGFVSDCCCCNYMRACNWEKKHRHSSECTGIYATLTAAHRAMIWILFDH